MPSALGRFCVLPARGVGRWMGRLVGLCLGLAGLPAAAVDRMQFVALSASVLKIEVIRQQGGYSLGSGVVVVISALMFVWAVLVPGRERSTDPVALAQPAE